MIIGVCGFIGTGKDTIADYLVGFHGYRRDSFAGTLKDAVAAVFGWDRELLEGITDSSRKFRETKDEYWSNVFGVHITPRYILQFFGTEVCRNNLHKDIWIKSLINKLSNSSEKIVISDVRFINEASAIKEMGGYILFIDRNNLAEQYNHSSELDIKEIGENYSDYIIHNHSTLDNYYSNILSILER